MSNPLVSVVIPVFNGLPYLREACASVIAQSYRNLELVLVDGGSSDGSDAWIRTLGAEAPFPIVTEFLPSGTTAAENWTRATELGSGEFIKLLCQDDVIYPDAIAKQLRLLHEFPSAAMAVGQRDIISASGKVIYRNRGCSGLPDGTTGGEAALHIAYKRAINIFGEPLAVLFRRENLLNNLPWNDRHPFMLDLEMYERVLTNGIVAVEHTPIGAFRVSSQSWSTRLSDQQKAQFAGWQSDFAARSRHHVSAPERRAAHRNLDIQTLLRSLAYRWLRLRKDLT